MKRTFHRLLSVLLLAGLFAGCTVEPGARWAAKKRARAAKRHAEELASIPPGETLFQERCQTCHAVRGKGGALGPDLSRIGRKRDAEYLEQVIRQPSQVFPGTVMPPSNTLSVEQVNALVDYLLTLK